MSNISIRVSEQEKHFIEKYSKFYGLSITDFVKRTIFERIEDDLDTKVAEQAWQEHLDNPHTYSLAELKKELGI